MLQMSQSVHCNWFIVRFSPGALLFCSVDLKILDYHQKLRHKG